MFRNLAPLLRKPLPAATPVLTDDGDTARGIVAAYLRLAPALYRYLYARTGSAHDAEDLAMDVFVQAWRHRFADINAFDAWLFTVAKHAADRFLRRRRPAVWADAVPEFVAAEAPPGELDPGSPVIVAFFALREDDRAILILRGLEERPMREVAQLLGISEAAAFQRWHRARLRFADLLRARGVKPPNMD